MTYRSPVFTCSIHKMKVYRMGAPAALLACLLSTLLLSEATTTGAETVKLTTTPIFPQIPRGQTSKDFQVLVRVEAPPAAGHMGRVPVDLAVVLNVGGGTARLDSVKKALLFIIRQLRDDDRLAVVGPSGNRLFGETATGFLDIRDARRNAANSLEKLQPRPRDGHAQQGSGLKEAIKMLSELPASTSSRASFIILVADTKESSRFSKLPREFLKNQPVVHTIGLGAAHDPKALLSIAEESHGTYSFVDDDQNTDSITGAVAVCLSGIKAVAAVGTRVSLEAAIGSGVRVERIESGGYSSAITGDRTAGEVTVGALYAGEAKSFIVHLNVPAVPPTSASVDGCCDKQELFTASFFGHYTASDGDASPPKIQATLSVQRPPPEGVAVAASLQKVPVPVVMDQIAQFGVLDMVATFVENEIWELSSITAEVGPAMATKLQSRWEEFVQARQFWSGLDLGVLEVEISKMVTILAAAGSGGGGSGPSPSPLSATAYMLSWLSSYQTQRPTAMGSPNSVAPAFATLSVQLTVQEATTIVVTAPGGSLGGDGVGGCPPCECDDSCVEPRPPPVFLPSGRDDDTYRVNAAYPAVLIDAINQAANQMYLALVQASNVRRCNSTNVEVALQPRAVV